MTRSLFGVAGNEFSARGPRAAQNVPGMTKSGSHFSPVCTMGYSVRYGPRQIDRPEAKTDPCIAKLLFPALKSRARGCVTIARWASVYEGNALIDKRTSGSEGTTKRLGTRSPNERRTIRGDPGACAPVAQFFEDDRRVHEDHRYH